MKSNIEYFAPRSETPIPLDMDHGGDDDGRNGYPVYVYEGDGLISLLAGMFYGFVMGVFVSWLLFAWWPL